jgi:signal transduction histidine kinase
MTIQSSSLKLVEFDDWLYGRYERYEERPSAVMGAGLGLAVARTIIELHGGRIGVNNTSQGGTEFQISLPAA